MQLVLVGFGWLTFVFLFLIFICMCIDVVPACMYAHHMCAWSLRRPEEGVRAPGAGVTICRERPCYHVGAENQMGLL